MKIEDLSFVLAHSKPYYPSKENAEKNIIQTLNKGLEKFDEIKKITTGIMRDTMKVFVLISFKDVPLTRVSVIENRINKIGRNVAKKHNTTFKTVKLK